MYLLLLTVAAVCIVGSVVLIVLLARRNWRAQGSALLVGLIGGLVGYLLPYDHNVYIVGHLFVTTFTLTPQDLHTFGCVGLGALTGATVSAYPVFVWHIRKRDGFFPDILSI